ncbi:response regulator, partial [Patescibacteria group bacterium]|nr:response regulator [Patescibacteria group bacterium]
KKLKIILIEDDVILSRVIGEELGEAGFDVVFAFEGSEGLILSESQKPDLVLLDLMLPGMNGLDILKKFKKDPSVKNIPIIILTMLGNESDIKKGLELGAEDYIVKSQNAIGEIVDKVKDFTVKKNI